MKKIYSLALAAFVAASASATSSELMQVNSIKPVHKATLSGVRMEKVAAPATSVRTMAAPMADDAEGIAGEYTITIGDYYNGDDSQGEIESTATIADNGDGTITISCEYFDTDVTAAYDAATGNITFTAEKDRYEQQIGGETYYVCFSPSMWDTTAEEIVATSYSVTYANEAIEFPADHGFGWAAYTSPRTDELAGWVTNYDIVSIFIDHSITYEDAQWTGNILSELFEDTSVVTEPSTVTVKYDPTTKIYTLFDAFGATFAQKGWGVSPKITIEAADPDNCIVPVTSTGINSSTDGLYGVCSESFTQKDPATTAENVRIKLTEDNKAITITFPVNSMLLYASGTQKLYYANYAESKLVINKEDSGVDMIGNDNADAPVEYFNLQGVKVAQPANGLYIVRQGNKVTKQVIR